MVLLVLIRIRLREVGDGLVEDVSRAEICADGRGATGSSVSGARVQAQILV